MKNISNDKVSVITACYNSENEIMETYSSLLSQTYANWEWLVTDDCSSDGTFSLISSLAEKDSRIKVFKNSINSGAAVSRNNSIEKSSGEYIAFIDSDDIWYPEKLKLQLEFMKLKNISFSFTAFELVDLTGNHLNRSVDFNNCEKVSYNDMLKKKATLGCSTVIIRRNAFTDISMPLLRTGQDYATWLKLLKEAEFAYIYNEVLTKYRIRPNSISRNKVKKAQRQWEIYRKVENLPLSKSLWCFFLYAKRAIFRK